MLRPGQLLATPTGLRHRPPSGTGTVVVSEFLGSDVVLTVDLAATRRRSGYDSPVSMRRPWAPGSVSRFAARAVVLGEDDGRMTADSSGTWPGSGERVAVITESERLTYASLAARVAQTAAALGMSRRLVLLQTRNEIGTLVALSGGSRRRSRRHSGAAGPRHRRCSKRPTCPTRRSLAMAPSSYRGEPAGSLLHEDLAMLLSTSGSTGSPKLVRLSRANLSRQRRVPSRSTSGSPELTGPQPHCRCRTATDYRSSTVTCCAVRH